MDEFKKFLKTIAVALAIFFTIIASAGSIDFGTTDPEPLYRIAGVLNLGWLYFPIRAIVRYFKKQTDEDAPAAKGGVSKVRDQKPIDKDTINQK